MPEPTSNRRGRLKVYLGYAAGVGKTYQMLADAQDLAHTGVDVVIGYFESHGRTDTILRAAGLENIPRRQIEYRGAIFEEMDVDAILRREPRVCLVDELAHTNVPGSGREKRWEDVLALLEHGIDVCTTVNIQHVESLNDQVWHLTGIRVRETVPDWVIKEAAEVVMVDATPQALINRLLRGAVYAPEKARHALENFFKESTLVALREMALRETAHEVEVRHVTPAIFEEPVGNDGARAPERPAAPAERILVYLTADASTALLIRRARRIADYIEAECFAVMVYREGELAHASPERRAETERILNFARNLHIETRTLEGPDVATTLVEFARLQHITQIFVARPRYTHWRWFLARNLIHSIVRQASDMEVVVVADRGAAPPEAKPR
jgi:two-component system, OmpR family, sensor histidine kinase KdpD